MAFGTGRTLAGIVALVQTALLLVAYLIGMQVIKEKKRNFRVLLVILAFVLIIPFLLCVVQRPSISTQKDVEKFQWVDIELCDMLPNPESDIGEIHTNTSSELWMDVVNISEGQYHDYIDACERKGFTIDAKEQGTSFKAYNENGYKLSLNHFDYSYSSGALEMSIKLEAPMELGKMQWPASAVANLLPVPESKVGKTEWEYESEFMIYVGETSKTQYDAYVNACQEKGFTVDYNKGDDYYYAYNDSGCYLALNYEGNNIMRVKVKEGESSSDSTDSISSVVEVDYIEKFVLKYNEIADMPITERTEFDPQNTESGYYRHEYRLTAWEGSVGEVGRIGDFIIEITNYGSYGGFYDENDSLRVYLTTASIEEMVNIVPALIKALDASATETEIQEVQNAIKETSFSQETFYVGEIDTILFLKNADSYELMLDT